MRTIAAKPLLHVFISVIGTIVLLMFLLFPYATLPVQLNLMPIIIASLLVDSAHKLNSFCEVKTSIQKLE